METTCTSKFYQAVVTFDKVSKAKLICVANNRNKNTIFRFYGKTNINRSWMNNACSNESTSNCRVFCQSNSKSPQDIERRSCLRALLFAMSKKSIELNWEDYRCQGSRPTPTHGISNGYAHRRSRSHFIALEIFKKLFKIINSHSPISTTSCHTC